MSKGHVAVEEALSIKIGNFLLKKDLILADVTGERISSLNERYALGILSRIKTKRLFFSRSHHFFIGVVSFEKDPWVFKVYGREFLEPARNIAEELAAEFGAHIIVKLIDEESRLEFSDISLFKIF